MDREQFEIIMKQANGSLMTALENRIQADISATRKEANMVANHILDILDAYEEFKKKQIKTTFQTEVNDMAKGMNLEEFRNALSSDATIENEKLKTELKELKEKSAAEIKMLKEKANQYEQWCRQLGNRCFVQTGGAMCISCDVGCCNHALTWQDWEAITKYMRENKLPRTTETYEKVVKFMHDRRQEKAR